MISICRFPEAIPGEILQPNKSNHTIQYSAVSEHQTKLLLGMSHLTGHITASLNSRKVFPSFPLIFFTCPLLYVTFSLPPLHRNVAVIPISPSLGTCDVSHPILHSTWRWFYLTTIACHFPPLPAKLAGCRVSHQRQCDKQAGRIRATDCCRIK
jgi:hypothetical protein